MNKSDFNFRLPPHLIAQSPLEQRDSSRLLCLNRQTGARFHRRFAELPGLLREGDLLVMNDSRVLPARLYGIKIPTGGAMQFLLLEAKGEDVWEILVMPGRKAKPGSRFTFGEGILTGEIIEVLPGGNRLAKLCYKGDFYNILDKIGQMPLPPYITRNLEDKERYQTVYSRETGSAAAPTAGLHFTPRLLDELRAGGVDTAFVTLHVGLGTFRPVKEENILNHHMHAEHYHLPYETAEKILAAKKRGNRVIGVGTTSCRTLESVARKYGRIQQDSGSTDIFIYPGYQFQVLDGLITNFHLPESTLIMLVSAFAGREAVLAAYEEAVEREYRFFSFGDAMLIL